MEQIISGEDITSFLIFLVVFALLHILLRKPKGIPPGPLFTIPILGDLLLLASGDIKGAFRKLRNKHGDIFSFYIGRQLVVVVNGYELISKVLVENGIQYCGRPQDCLSELRSNGVGLTFATGVAWQKQRQFVDRALSKVGIMKRSFENNIMAEVSELTAVLDRQEGLPTDIRVSLQASVVNAIFAAVVGKRHAYDDPVFLKMLECADMEAVNGSQMGILLNCLPFLKFIPGDPFQTKIVQKNYTIFEKNFDKHFLKDIKTTSGQDESFLHIYAAKIQEEAEGDFSVFTPEQMKMVVWDLFLATAGTVEVTIQWAILYLLNFPDIQHRLQRSIEEVTGDKTPTLADKIKLPYVTAFLAEVLRNHVTPIIARSEINDKDSYFEGYLIPKGSMIMCIKDSISMDPSVFEEPEKFDPDRFLDCQGNYVEPKKYISAFSAGRRKCMGERIANNELFLFLVSLLKTFTFLPADTENIPKIEGRFRGKYFAPNDYEVRCIRRM